MLTNAYLRGQEVCLKSHIRISQFGFRIEIHIQINSKEIHKRYKHKFSQIFKKAEKILRKGGGCVFPNNALLNKAKRLELIVLLGFFKN